MTMMRLHYSDTLAPRKTCAAARHLGLPIAFRFVDLERGAHKAPEYLAINPNGKVPALEDGALRLWESNAIICHLAMRAGSNLWPRDAAGQVEALRWMSWEADALNRHGGALYFEHIIKPRFALGPPEEAVLAAETRHFRAAASVVEAHLDGRRFLLGDALSVADFAVAAVLPYAGAAQIPLADFPRMARWHDRLMALPAWADPYPKQMTEAPAHVH
jgi:glutathione S-transferase